MSSDASQAATVGRGQFLARNVNTPQCLTWLTKYSANIGGKAVVVTGGDGGDGGDGGGDENVKYLPV